MAGQLISTQISGSIFEQVRRPDVLYTSNYLNDAIKYDTDPRLQLVSGTLPGIRQLDDSSGELFQYRRDQADFLVADLNDTGSIQWNSVQLYSPLYDRAQVERTIDRAFRQFLTASVTEE
jgi:hypothetical protein